MPGVTILDNCLSSGQKITVLATVIATALAEGLTPDEENIIGNLIMQIGTTLLTIAAIDEAKATSLDTSDSKNSTDSGQTNQQLPFT